MIKIKAKQQLDKIFPLLFSALGGKVSLDNGITIEIFNAKFTFDVERVGDKVVITFSGNKPRITATKSVLFFSMDFQGRIARVSLDGKTALVELDGLPNQKIEFI